MMIRLLSFASLVTLIGVAVFIIVGKQSYADYLGVLIFSLYTMLVIGTVIHWLFKKEK